MREKRIDDLNRTERYFTSTLMAGLLFHNNLQGTREFINWLTENKDIELNSIKEEQKIPLKNIPPELPDQLEIVTELNIKREISFYNISLNCETESISEKQNVPDIVIVYGDKLFVIEGKFFVSGQSDYLIDSQLAMQKEEISIMVNHLSPSIKYTSHIFLGPDASYNLQNCDLIISWKDIENFSRQLLGENHYITQRLARANQRYQKDCRPATNGERINFSGRLSFEQIISLCEERGSNIIVGFMGGMGSLIQTSLRELYYRKFKWDDARNPTGKKSRKNWLSGDEFLLRINEKIEEEKMRGNPIEAEEMKVNRTPRKSRRNYYAQVSFEDIISLCKEYQNKILIGFNGGTNALMNAHISKLKTRRFKYDFSDESIGTKKSSNWINGEKFLRLIETKLTE